MVNGTPVSEAKVVADEFNRYFHSVYTLKDINVVTEPEGFISSMQDLVVHREGILNLLLELDAKKAGGPDNIPTVFLRRYAEWISHYLLIIYNMSLAQCSLSLDWKGARIIPINKSSDCLRVSNYRPISLTSTSCKMLEHNLPTFDHIFRRKLFAIRRPAWVSAWFVNNDTVSYCMPRFFTCDKQQRSDRCRIFELHKGVR